MNHRRLSQRIYSPPPLTTRAPLQPYYDTKETFFRQLNFQFSTHFMTYKRKQHACYISKYENVSIKMILLHCRAFVRASLSCIILTDVQLYFCICRGIENVFSCEQQSFLHLCRFSLPALSLSSFFLMQSRQTASLLLVIFCFADCSLYQTQILPLFYAVYSIL